MGGTGMDWEKVWEPLGGIGMHWDILGQDLGGHWGRLGEDWEAPGALLNTCVLFGGDQEGAGRNWDELEWNWEGIWGALRGTGELLVHTGGHWLALDRPCRSAPPLGTPRAA